MKWLKKLKAKIWTKYQKTFHKENGEKGNCILENNSAGLKIFGSPGIGKISSFILPEFADTSTNAEGIYVPLQEDPRRNSPIRPDILVGTVTGEKGCNEDFFRTRHTIEYVEGEAGMSSEQGVFGSSKHHYEKDEVKEMLCKAIDNIPDCAKIMDCYTEHSFMSDEAYIKIYIEVQDKTGDNIIDFHNKAHDAFESGMDSIS